jgi:predicted nucleic acid-binding Zn ribbon protein
MERASKLIQGMRLPSEMITAEEVACTAWAHAVGKKIAVHTRAVRMVRTRLVVEVEDVVWQRQLFALTRQILVNLEKNLGPGMVDDLEFKIVPRRRGPQRAAESVPVSQDEAANIADPVMRSIYKAARMKAGA